MTITRFKAKNHPQQVRLNGPNDDVDDRRTPDELWLPLHDEFRFTLDAAARPWNSKTPRHCTDGLSESWAGERVWCNPPFSDVRPWVEKAWAGCALLIWKRHDPACDMDEDCRCDA